jgi:HEAT repeat protein
MTDSQDRDNILEDLNSSDDEIRRLAVERLTLLPTTEAMPALVERLGDPSWRVRKAAVERLAESPESGEVIRHLVAALRDGENTGRRNAALETLMRCGRKSIPALIDASRDPDADVRKQVVDALAGIAEEGATDRLLEILRDPDANVRGAAADALGAIGSASAVPALLKVATLDAEGLVRLSALCALRRMQSSVTTGDLATCLEVSMLRPAAYALLGYSEDPLAIDWLLKGAVDASRSCREAAFEALLDRVGHSDPALAARLIDRIRETIVTADEIFPDALARLSSANLRTRLTLVQFLGLLQRPESVIPILLAGVDEALAEVVLSTLQGFGRSVAEILTEHWEALDLDARRLACELLGRIEGGAGQNRLITTLLDPDAGVRIAAARALGHRAQQSALPELVRRLEAVSVEQDEGDGVEEEEVEAITEAIVAVATSPEAQKGGGTEQVVELLISRREGAEERFRLAIARIMGAIGGPDDAAAIDLMMSDPSESVRRASVEALARLSRGGVPEPLRMALADEAAMVRIAAASMMGASEDAHAVEDLASLARDEDPHVRAAAMRALGSIASRLRDRKEGSEAVAVGLAVLARALEDEGAVALAALESLTALGGPDAAELAARMLGADDPELIKVAVGCVRSHGSAEALHDLLPLISHDHWMVRSEVVQTLADRGVESAVPTILRWLEREQDDFVRDTILRALKRLET